MKRIIFIMFFFTGLIGYGVEYRNPNVMWKLKMVDGGSPLKDWEVGRFYDDPNFGPGIHLPGEFYVTLSKAVFICDFCREGKGVNHQPRIIIVRDSLFSYISYIGFPFGNKPGIVYIIRDSSLKVYDWYGHFIKQIYHGENLISYGASIENGNVCIREKGSDLLRFFNEEGKYLLQDGENYFVTTVYYRGQYMRLVNLTFTAQDELHRKVVEIPRIAKFHSGNSVNLHDSFIEIIILLG